MVLLPGLQRTLQAFLLSLKSGKPMKYRFIRIAGLLLLGTAASLRAQTTGNCFLVDYEPKTAVIPAAQVAEKSANSATVTVTISVRDTLGPVSKYLFGNALAVWVGNDVMNKVLIGNIQKLSPTLIRYPGGSWGDIFFWNGNPGDLPSTIPDGTNNGTPATFYPQYGINSWSTTLVNYYALRDQANATQGLITINYGYARYGLSEKPVEQAAHLAADWVRHDEGRTRFWEIGNENGGPWEAGWQIDTTMNRDGQPKIITGELYGRHFRIFADSMRAAAAEIDETIYIGGQILHYDGTTSWNIADRNWNEGFLREVGDYADFYVMHNYFGGTTVSMLKSQIDLARNEINKNITFIRQDIARKQAFNKPVALTEWNMVDHPQAATSIANGMQAVVLTCEMIQNNFGMAARWLLVHSETGGMFYKGASTTIPAWSPRPDVYYLYYLQHFTGDHSVKSAVAGSSDILAYASTFSSGQAAAVIVNKGDAEKVIKLAIQNFTAGDHYYLYSLTGGTGEQYAQTVKVNGIGPTGAAFGPAEGLGNIPAQSYMTGDEIRIVSPARSVQYLLIEGAVNSVAAENSLPRTFGLHQNYPNPFNARTTITYTLPHAAPVDLRIHDMTGREIAVLRDGDKESAGEHSLAVDATPWPSGLYFYTLQSDTWSETRKMLMIK
jgi:hypothetical protein